MNRQLITYKPLLPVQTNPTTCVALAGSSFLAGFTDLDIFETLIDRAPYIFGIDHDLIILICVKSSKGDFVILSRAMILMFLFTSTKQVTS